MPRMICTRSFTYGKRVIQPAEEFDAESEEHAKVLEAGDKARRVNNHVGQGYKTRQLIAEDTIRAPQLGQSREQRRKDRKNTQ